MLNLKEVVKYWGPSALSIGMFSACSTPTTGQAIFADRSLASVPPSECSVEVSPSQQSVIDEVMGSHAHRLYHFLWHATRNSWADLKKGERKVIQSLDPEWGKNAPLCPLPAKDISTASSPSGEEFLLMHHQMVANLQSALAAKGLPCIQGWKSLPARNDRNFPVPSGTPDDTSKSDATGARMDAWAKKLHDPAFLKGKSLSYIGVLVEFTIHNNMHMRWAEVPKTGDDFSPMDKKFTSQTLLAPSAYDGPNYHWLGNPYSAHVNPIFWKLHGWVDDTILAWLGANGYSSIAADCGGKAGCYAWKSNWVGGSMHSANVPKTSMPRDTMPGGSGDDADLGEVLKKISAKAGFGNPKFDRELRYPRETATRGGAKGPPSDPLADPEVFLTQYGPCSGN
jgi:hypothetical protein